MRHTTHDHDNTLDDAGRVPCGRLGCVPTRRAIRLSVNCMRMTIREGWTGGVQRVSGFSALQHNLHNTPWSCPTVAKLQCSACRSSSCIQQECANTGHEGRTWEHSRGKAVDASWTTWPTHWRCTFLSHRRLQHRLTQPTTKKRAAQPRPNRPLRQHQLSNRKLLIAAARQTIGRCLQASFQGGTNSNAKAETTPG